MPDNYVNNAVRMWSAYGPADESTPAYARFEAPRTRIILRRRHESVTDLMPAIGAIEDSWGESHPPDEVITRRMAVMDRQPAPLDALIPEGITVTPVRDPDELAEAECVVVDGFPMPAYQPWTRGTPLPPRLLDVPGWTAWLARHDSTPAAAAVTFDDGVAVGVYWLATLPEHRSKGLARAIMTASLAAHPDRVATLVATAAGEPLYRSLGFVTVSEAAWYIRIARD